MSQGWRTGWIVAALIFSASALGGMLLFSGLLIWQIAEVTRFKNALPETLEMFVDQQIDDGFANPEFRTDDPLLQDRKIFLGHDVNARSAKDVATRLFFLDQVDPKKPIDLYLATQGGWVDNAFTIIDAMRLIEAPVNTWAVGGCYSSGTLILAAGTGRRISTDNAVLMVHTNLDDSDEEYSFDRLDLARIENVWRQMTDLPESWFPMTSNRRYFFNASEALKFKVIDEIVTTWPDGGDPSPD